MPLFTQPRTRPDKILYSILRIEFCILVPCAIIAALCVPKFNNHPRPSPEDITRIDLSILQSTLDSLFQDTGRYPTTSEGLNALITNPNLPNWEGPYIKKIPNDPWGSPYVYQSHGKPPTKYTLSSNGPDKSPHTDDDIRDP